MTDTARAGEVAPAPPRVRPEASQLLHVFVLCCLAIAQPLFEVFAATPQYFVASRSQPLDILLLVGALVLLVPTVLVLLELALGLVHPLLRLALHLLVVAVLLAVLVLPWIRQAADGLVPGPALLALAALLGALGATVYARAPQARRFVSYLAFVLPVFPALFVFSSAVTELVFPTDTVPQLVVVGCVLAGCGLLALRLLAPRLARPLKATGFTPQRRRLLVSGGATLLGLGVLLGLGRRGQAADDPNDAAQASGDQAAAGGGQAAQSATSASAHMPPVVMLILDEIALSSLLDEQQQIDAASFPNFASLAREAHWFRNATTVADYTIYAIPSILNGRYPTRKHRPITRHYRDNLFTLLESTHEMKVIESMTSICPDDLCPNQLERAPRFQERMQTLASDLGVISGHLLLPRDLASGLPSLDSSWSNFSATASGPDAEPDDESEPTQDESESGDDDESTEADRPANFVIPHELFELFVEQLVPADRPRLHFLHVMLPHRPWRYLPSGVYYDPDESMRDQNDVWSTDPWVTTQFYQRYLLQVAYMDTLLGDMLARLKETGLYDTALVVVTADHGLSFKPGGHRRAITQDNFEDILPVPLFVKLPGQREGVLSDRNVQTIDILPTIAHVLGIPLPASVDGVPIFDASIPEPTAKTYIAKKAFRPVTVGPTIQEKQTAIAQKLSVFGPGRVQDQAFQIGPYAAVIGSPVDQLNVGGPIGATVDLNGDQGLQNHNPESSYVPAQLTGRITLTQDTDQPLNLAVAVNGVVHATTRAYVDSARIQRLSALLPDRAFVAGANEIALYHLSGPTEQPTAQAVEVRLPLAFSLTSAGQDLTIVSSTGASFRVVAGATAGQVQHVEACGAYGTVTGWSVDADGTQVVEAVVMFVGDKLVWAGPTTLPRPEVVKEYRRDDLLVSGFKAFLPLDTLRGEAGRNLRVFGISQRGLASELERPPDLLARDEDSITRTCHF